MSKNKQDKDKDEAEVIVSFSVARQDSGYYITKHTTKNQKLISSEKVTEPDVLVITMSNLERIVRKQHGL